MERAIGETNRRREKQQAFNEEHGITPQKLVKKVADVMEMGGAKKRQRPQQIKSLRQVAESEPDYAHQSPQQLDKSIKALEAEMYQHAQNLEFEQAAAVRDKIQTLRETFILNS